MFIFETTPTTSELRIVSFIAFAFPSIDMIALLKSLILVADTKKSLPLSARAKVDNAMQNIKHLVDQAIDDALGEGITKKNYDSVMSLIQEESSVLEKILDTTVYNEGTGHWVPSDNGWLYHFIRARPAIPQNLRPNEKPEYLKI